MKELTDYLEDIKDTIGIDYDVKLSEIEGCYCSVGYKGESFGKDIMLVFNVYNSDDADYNYYGQLTINNKLFTINANNSTTFLMLTYQTILRNIV